MYKLFSEIEDSGLNIFGRLAITALFITIYTYINLWACSVSPTASFMWLMLLGWFFYAMAAVCILAAGAFAVVIVGGVLWIFSGEYDENVAFEIVIIPAKIIKFIFLAIFGDWNRLFWRKNEIK